jgi:coenzyme F420-dependent glucose-6-phosphate dehydrogenase
MRVCASRPMSFVLFGRVKLSRIAAWSKSKRRSSIPVRNAPPLLIGAAVTDKTAEWLGGWADGLITTSRPPAEAAKLIEAFRRGGGEGKPIFLKVGLCRAKTDDEARRLAFEQWRTPNFSNEVLTELRTPREFDEVARYVRPTDLDRNIRISADFERHVAWLQADLDLGFQELILHNVGANQEEFIDAFGERVLPKLG